MVTLLRLKALPGRLYIALEVRREGLRQVGPRRDAACREVVELERQCVTHHQQEVGRHVVEAAAGRLDSDIVGSQPNVGVGAAVVLLDVELEVFRVGDRPETWRQRGEGGDRHVVAVVADLSRIVIPRCSHDLGSKLSARVTDRTLGVAVFGLVLDTPSVLDIVAFALLALHDTVDAAWRAVFAVVVEATSELPLLAFAVMLVDVAAGIATTPLLVEVGA
jgi:hypothetical protein